MRQSEGPTKACGANPTNTRRRTPDAQARPRDSRTRSIRTGELQRTARTRTTCNGEEPAKQTRQATRRRQTDAPGPGDAAEAGDTAPSSSLCAPRTRARQPGPVQRPREQTGEPVARTLSHGQRPREPAPGHVPAGETPRTGPANPTPTETRPTNPQTPANQPRERRPRVDSRPANRPRLGPREPEPASRVLASETASESAREAMSGGPGQRPRAQLRRPGAARIPTGDIGAARFGGQVGWACVSRGRVVARRRTPSTGRRLGVRRPRALSLGPSHGCFPWISGVFDRFRGSATGTA
jgi:hypothetical protein